MVAVVVVVMAVGVAVVEVVVVIVVVVVLAAVVVVTVAVVVMIVVVAVPRRGLRGPLRGATYTQKLSRIEPGERVEERPRRDQEGPGERDLR